MARRAKDGASMGEEGGEEKTGEREGWLAELDGCQGRDGETALRMSARTTHMALQQSSEYPTLAGVGSLFWSPLVGVENDSRRDLNVLGASRGPLYRKTAPLHSYSMLI